MDTKQLVTFGALGAATIVAVMVASRGTHTSFATDPGSAAVDQSIIAANATAIQTGASVENNMIAAATSLATVHDNNQTALAIAANSGATQTQLATIAAKSTQDSALLDTAAHITDTLSNNSLGLQLAKLGETVSLSGQYYDAKTAAGQQATDIAVSANQGAAATALARIQGNNATNLANISSNTQETLAQISGDAVKSAASSNMWGSIVGGLTGIAANIFTGGASGAAGAFKGWPGGKAA